jgi:hypothetical protein
MLRTLESILRPTLTGCSSDWQSAAFGTQKSLVQIQSPRLSFHGRRLRLALVGGVVAATVGGIAPPTRAEDVSTREEVVAREAPGTAEAGIAVLRGNERVQLLRDRDGWSEILLADGRRGWVPTNEIVRADSKVAATPVISLTPDATAHADAIPAAQASLVIEIARLRSVIGAFESQQRPETASSGPAVASEAGLLVAAAGTFVVGVLVGAAWQRRRTRRERSLKF